MKLDRSAAVHWEGGLRDGRGAVSTESTAIGNIPYAFASRFEGQAGTNPEELIAAGHAACFTMSFTLALSGAELTASRIDTKAIVTLVQDDTGFSIPHIRLSLDADVPGGDPAKLRELAEYAEKNCPVSKLFKAEITLDTKFGA